MRNTEEKNIHAGHRERLSNLVAKAGIENVSDVQALEFVLTYIFPRGDVNPLAHRLLDKFGTFADVLDADPIELESAKSIENDFALTRNISSLHNQQNYWKNSCKRSIQHT